MHMLPTDDPGYARSALTQRQAPFEAGLLEVLWRRRWVFVASLSVFILAAVAYLLCATRVYQATARISIDQNAPRIFSETQGNILPSDTFLQTQADKMQSTPVLSHALEATHYRQLQTFAQVNDALDWLRNSGALKIEAERKADVITISMESPYASEARVFVDAVIQSYVAAQAHQTRSNGGEMLSVLKSRKAELEQRRDDSRAAMLKFKRDSGVLSFGNDKSNTGLERISSLSTALTTAEVNTMDLRAQQDSIKTALSNPSLFNAFVEAKQVESRESGDREYDDLRSQLNSAANALRQAEELQGPNHPHVQVLRSAVEDLRQRIVNKERTIAEAQLVAISTQLASAEQKETQLRTALSRQHDQEMNLDPKAMEYTRLDAQVAQLQKQIDALDNRIAEVSVNTADVAPMNVSILDAAQVAPRPVKPKKMLVLAVALMLGCLSGIGLSMVRDWRDARLHDPAEIQRLLGTTVIATVPRINPRLSPVTRGQVVCLDARSPVAEAYHSVRASLHLGRGGGAKTLLLASPTHGDGKSTTASNLAIAFARAGERTLLIDCDLRDPVQHLIFTSDNAVGLTSVLAGEARLADAVRPSGVDGLYLLPCGPAPANPAELLAGKRFESLMAALLPAFDRIIIDSPPLIRFADARILAASVDATLLVFRMNQSMRVLGALALDVLDKVGANVLGAIANDVPSRDQGYYGGGWQYATHRRRVPALAASPALENASAEKPEALTYSPSPRAALETGGPTDIGHTKGNGSTNGHGNDVDDEADSHRAEVQMDQPLVIGEPKWA